MPERRLRRFFTGIPIPAPGEKVYLTPSETGHLKRTLRLHLGDRCLVTDGAGKEAEAVIAGFPANGETELMIEKLNSPSFPPAPSIQLTVYPALIQKGKIDDLVRRMQELGVDGFFPIETERTIIKMECQAKARMAGRWEKIVREAAKQSGSLISLRVGEPVALKEALGRIPAGDRIAVFHPDAEAMKFGDWVDSLCHPEPLGACHLFFGPEGGFSDKEVSFFKNQNIPNVSLGPTLLKADTALLGVVAALKFLFL